MDSQQDSACPYIAHRDSPILLQFFHAGTTSFDYAITALSSPAGKLRFQILQHDFPKLIKNVLMIADLDARTALQNLNTLPMMVVFDATQNLHLLKEYQDKIETDKTPIGLVHIGYGSTIIVVALVFGFLVLDLNPRKKYKIISE